MNALAQGSAALSSLILLAVFPLEAFLIDRAWVQRFLSIESEGIAQVHLWSFCIGARNALGAAGALIGLWQVNFGDQHTGLIVVLVSLWYQLLASLAMGVADLLGFWRPRGGSVMGVVASSVLPAIALVAIWFG